MLGGFKQQKMYVYGICLYIFEFISHPFEFANIQADLQY